MSVNMEELPDDIHTKISLFAAKNGLKKGEARNMILDSVLTEEGELDNQFMHKLNTELGDPY